MTADANIDRDKHLRVHQLWDELAGFSAEHYHQTLEHLILVLSELVGADHSFWLSAARMDEPYEQDPYSGWRPLEVHYVPELNSDQAIYREGSRNMESGLIDESAINHTRKAGQFRATLLRDHVSAQYWDSLFFHARYTERGLIDALFVTCTINCDTEIYFTFQRSSGLPMFTSSECDLAAYALRPLTWFLKHQLLSRGLLIANKPLTNTERKVLHQLLVGLSEKEVAKALKHSVDTTHKHVKSIYRKFNVSSRGALMALWLGASNKGSPE